MNKFNTAGIYFVLFLVPFHSIAKIDNFMDVVTHPSFQTDIAISKEVSKIEDLEMAGQRSNSCNIEVTEDKQCQSLNESLMPAHLKSNGWQVLFEVKYGPSLDRTKHTQSRSTSDVAFKKNTKLVAEFYGEDEIKKFKTENELRAEADRISKNHPESLPSEFYGPLLLNQLQQATTHDELMKRFRELTSNLNDQEFTTLMTHFGGWAEYNNKRAAMVQEEDGAKGVVTPLQIITQSKNGICGDIHGMVAKFAEDRGWEAFTVGYATNETQHVVTAMVDPKNPEKIMVVNYGQYEEHALNEGNSVVPAPSRIEHDRFVEFGTQLRIFKNTGGDGKMKSIATVPTALGSFMRGLFNHTGQAQKAMPENENYRMTKAGVEHSKSSVKAAKKDGVIEKNVGHGIVVYEGATDNSQIYGIAVSKDVFNHLYKYDEKLKRCVRKRSSYFSLGVAASLIDFPQADLLNNYFIYLNMRGGKIYHIYQTDFFQFKGLIGYEIDASLMLSNEGYFVIGDGNISGFAGAMAEFEKDGKAIYGGVRFETTPGLRDQGLMTDIATLPKNLNFLGFNALAFDAGAGIKVGDKTKIKTDNQYIMSQVGSRVILSTSVIHKNSALSVAYQGSPKGLQTKNSLAHTNLLRNFSGPDGYRLSFVQNYNLPSVSGSVGGYLQLPKEVKAPTHYGATIKANIGKKKK